MNNNNVQSFTTGLLVGMLGGVVAGLLLAPKSGKELREDIAKVAQNLSEQVRSHYQDLRKELLKKIENLKALGEEIDKEKYNELIDEVLKEFKKARKVTAQTARELGNLLADDWNDVKSAVLEK